MKKMLMIGLILIALSFSVYADCPAGQTKYEGTNAVYTQGTEGDVCIDADGFFTNGPYQGYNNNQNVWETDSIIPVGFEGVVSCADYPCDLVCESGKCKLSPEFKGNVKCDVAAMEPCSIGDLIFIGDIKINDDGSIDVGGEPGATIMTPQGEIPLINAQGVRYDKDTGIISGTAGSDCNVAGMTFASGKNFKIKIGADGNYELLEGQGTIPPYAPQGKFTANGGTITLGDSGITLRQGSIDVLGNNKYNIDKDSIYEKDGNSYKVNRGQVNVDGRETSLTGKPGSVLVDIGNDGVTDARIDNLNAQFEPPATSRFTDPLLLTDPNTCRASSEPCVGMDKSNLVVNSNGRSEGNGINVILNKDKNNFRNLEVLNSGGDPANSNTDIVTISAASQLAADPGDIGGFSTPHYALVQTPPPGLSNTDLLSDMNLQGEIKQGDESFPWTIDEAGNFKCGWCSGSETPADNAPAPLAGNTAGEATGFIGIVGRAWALMTGNAASRGPACNHPGSIITGHPSRSVSRPIGDYGSGKYVTIEKYGPKTIGDKCYYIFRVITRQNSVRVSDYSYAVACGKEASWDVAFGSGSDASSKALEIANLGSNGALSSEELFIVFPLSADEQAAMNSAKANDCKANPSLCSDDQVCEDITFRDSTTYGQCRDYVAYEPEPTEPAGGGESTPAPTEPMDTNRPENWVSDDERAREYIRNRPDGFFVVRLGGTGVASNRPGTYTGRQIDLDTIYLNEGLRCDGILLEGSEDPHDPANVYATDNQGRMIFECQQ